MPGFWGGGGGGRRALKSRYWPPGSQGEGTVEVGLRMPDGSQLKGEKKRLQAQLVCRFGKQMRRQVPRGCIRVLLDAGCLGEPLGESGAALGHLPAHGLPQEGAEKGQEPALSELCCALAVSGDIC